MQDSNSQKASSRFCDAVGLWKIGATDTGDVIDAAVECLLAEMDSPTLRELAGASPRDSRFELDPMIERTLEELGLGEILDVGPQRWALAAMIRRFKNGELSARELTRWAHTIIGHDGDSFCQAFVELDDMYDIEDYFEYDAGDLDRWVGAEADAFLDGRPSPGISVWRTPHSPL